MNPHQLKRYIDITLRQELNAGYTTNSATYQLLMTAEAESDCGEFIYQYGDGPAKGIFQIEPNTEKLIWEWCLKNNYHLLNTLIRNSTGTLFGGTDLIGNMKYQIILARANYYSWPYALPKIDNPISDSNIKNMAEYWKNYWNTEKGKGRINDAIEKYEKFVGKDV